MRLVGFALFLVGFLCSLTIIGAIVGIPLMLIGIAMYFMGGRKTVITNTVTVHHAAEPAPTTNAAPRSPTEMDAIPQSSTASSLEDRSTNLEG